MTDYAADRATSAGVTTTERSGAAGGTDTVPAGSVLVLRNTGVGSHNVDLTLGSSAVWDGMQPSNVAGTLGIRRHTIAAAAIRLVQVPGSYGDANGRVPIAVDGTATEVKYYIVGV